MARKAIIMANLQQEMDKTKTGVLLSVKLLNKDELNVLIADTSAIIDKFCVMVHTACEKSGDYSLVKTSDPTNMYIYTSR